MLDETHQLLQQTCRDYCAKELEPLASKLDAEAKFPNDVVQQIANMGLLGMLVPEAYGGAGMDVLSGALAIEEISRACAGTALGVSVHNFLVTWTLLQQGTDQQKHTFLMPLASGHSLGCFCVTEPHAGSDVASLETTAVLEGNHWVLNGVKTWVTNATQADTALIFAREPNTKGKTGISVFIVPLKSQKGLNVSSKENLLGMRAADVARITLNNVKVPQDYLLGEVGHGFPIAMSAFAMGRIGISAQALGIATAAYLKALRYTKEREQFGKSIASNQGVQWALADMATALEASRLMVYAAAVQPEANRLYAACSAKWFATDAAMRICTQAIQLHGGYGYIKEFSVERHYRDAKVAQIYAGTTEMQQKILGSLIAKGRPNSPNFIGDALLWKSD